LSYKYNSLKYQRLLFNWEYHDTPGTLPIRESYWHSLSLEVAQSVSKNTTYELHFSYYKRFQSLKPGDPFNPGHTLDPDDIPLQSTQESFTDRNNNGIYDAPEPIINLFPDTAIYGTNVTGPAYTFGEFNLEQNNQGGEFTISDFRFNDNGIIDFLEGEPYIDLNGNGVWDAGDLLNDQNGNGELDPDRVSVINNRRPESFIDGDVVLGEPFTDVDGDGVYSRGIDIFILSPDPAINQDLNRNSEYDGPSDPWSPGIPYEDRNRNGVYDAPNFRYDPGEKFTDVNGNGKWDAGGGSTFLDPGNHDIDAQWQEQTLNRYRGEIKIFHQAKNHELKLGGALTFEQFDYFDISRPYLQYTGRPDGGPFADRGAFRDVFGYNPWRGTVYFRDKLEYGSMIASLGFRWDFFIQDTDKLVEIAVNDDLGSGVIKGDRQKFSPRIGFSYPISDKAKVYFNYGHFFQLPSYRFMYARNTSSVDQNDVVGNYNLDYQKTIQYSFGVKYALTDNYALDISGYFKDEFDKINSASVRVGGLTRQQYRNSDYGRSRGFELTLDKRGGGYVTGQLSYTYAFAFGKASQTNENYLEDFELSNQPLDEAPLDNDIRHSFKAAVSIYIPTSVKPKLFGVPIFNGWSLTVESIIESGRPFTPTSSYPGITLTGSEAIERNSLRYPATAVFDARFAKQFLFAGLRCEAILWVENVLDSRNVQGVYANTGRPDTQTTQTVNGENIVKGGTEYDADPFNWDYGRQIRLGLEITI
jgi:outer membrane receptor protein involved in Fe transport